MMYGHLVHHLEGWQPGIQEGAVDWDEEWDKFEDEGMSPWHKQARIRLLFLPLALIQMDSTMLFRVIYCLVLFWIWIITSYTTLGHCPCFHFYFSIQPTCIFFTS